MTAVTASVWTDMLSYIRREHPQLVRAWFADLDPAELSGGVVRILAVNEAQVRYLERSVRTVFIEAAQAVTGRLVDVCFEARETSPAERSASGSAELACPDGLPVSSVHSFDSLVTGPCNRLAVAAAKAVAENPGTAYNPLFVHGPAGTGKSHILNAICLAIRSTHPDLHCVFVSGEGFTNQCMAAEEHGESDRFRERYARRDVLVLDNVHRLSGRPRSQEAFFHLFNRLLQAQRQVVLSATCAPSEIPEFAARLESRFASGLVVGIDPACQETRLAIVRKIAESKCLDMPSDVAETLARQFEGSVTELLRTLDEWESQSARRSAAPALSPLENTSPSTPGLEITVPAIARAVSGRFRIEEDDLRGLARSKHLTHARNVSIYLAINLTNCDASEIGPFFGGRSAASVTRGYRALRDQAAVDPALRVLLDELANQVKNTSLSHSAIS